MKFFICTVLLLASGRAFAGEGLFSRAYTTETVPQGHFELEQLIRNREHRAFGDYSADDFKTEFEYGVTDNFQVALYLNTEYMYASGAPDDSDDHGQTGFSRNSFEFQGISTEFIYRVLSPVTDPIGLAFYLEPEWDFFDMHDGLKEFNGFSNEFRILFQKNFLGDRLVFVYNLVAEYEYYRYGDFNADGSPTLFTGELDWNNEIGITYRFADGWYAGLEGRNHNEIGEFWSHDHSVYWAGPAVHYANQRFWATLGVLKEVYGDPDGWSNPDPTASDFGSFDGPGDYHGGNHLFLHSHELIETTLKFAFAF